MTDLTLTSISFVGLTVFTSSVTVIALHFLEWLHIHVYPRKGSKSSNFRTSLLTVELGGEMVYYFGLLATFASLLPDRITLLTAVAFLGVVHLGAFWGMVGGRGEGWLRNLRGSRLTAVLVFDCVEVLVLGFLAWAFNPWTGTML